MYYLMHCVEKRRLLINLLTCFVFFSCYTSVCDSDDCMKRFENITPFKTCIYCLEYMETEFGTSKLVFDNATK